MMDNDSILGDIDEIYYSSEDEFKLSDLTSQLPENPSSEFLLSYKARLEKSLNLVSSRVSELILSHQPTYVDELKRISDLQEYLNQSIKSCSESRACLAVILNSGAKNGSILVEHYKKRETLRTLLDALTTIDDLHKSVMNIRQCIDQQPDFPRAIKYCRDGKSILESHHQFDCVKDMDRRLNLLLMSHDFSRYRFDEFIQVLGIVDLMIRVGDDFNSESRSSKEILDCINTQAMNFFKAYHKQSMDEQMMFLENELWDMIPVKSNFKLVHLKEFHFLRTTSKDHPSRTLSHRYLAGSGHLLHDQLQLFAKEEPLESLHSQNHQEITRLHDAYRRQQMINFTNLLPIDKILGSAQELEDDLFESNEIEEKSRPALERSQLDSSQVLLMDKISLSSVSDDDVDDDDDEELDPELNKDFVDEEEFINTNYPNDEKAIEKSHIEPASKNNNIELQQQQQPRFNLTRTPGPVVTNSSLNILRLIGRYIQMMIVLKPISYEILMKIYSLLEHYTVMVYKKFGPGMKQEESRGAEGETVNMDRVNLSPKLRQVMKSIKASLVAPSRPDMAPPECPNPAIDLVISQSGNQEPSITSLINEEFRIPSGTTTSDELIGDAKKAVAVESLIYLVNQLWNLQEFLESLIPSEMRHQLREQFSQRQSVVPDFLRARAELASRGTG